MHRWIGPALRRSRAFGLAAACVVVTLLSSGAVRTSLGADDVACDAKRVVKVIYCEKDARILEKSDLASGKAEFRCPSCNASAPKEGECKDCKQALEKREHPKGSCSHCGTEPIQADACQREAFQCPKCNDKRVSKGKCATCGVGLKKVPDLALVKYVCAGCGTSALASGNCTKEGCSHMGKKLDKVCTAAGSAPHVKEHKDEKPKKDRKPKGKGKDKDDE